MDCSTEKCNYHKPFGQKSYKVMVLSSYNGKFLRATLKLASVIEKDRKIIKYPTSHHHSSLPSPHNLDSCLLPRPNPRSSSPAKVRILPITMTATLAMIDELIEEFLLRLSPTNPVSLIDTCLQVPRLLHLQTPILP